MVHGLSHGVVTLIRTIAVCYGPCVVSSLFHFDLGSIWPYVITALFLS